MCLNVPTCRLDARGGAAHVTAPSQWQMAFVSSVVHRTGWAEADTVPRSSSRLQHHRMAQHHPNRSGSWSERPTANSCTGIRIPPTKPSRVVLDVKHAKHCKSTPYEALRHHLARPTWYFCYYCMFTASYLKVTCRHIKIRMYAERAPLCHAHGTVTPARKTAKRQSSSPGCVR